MRKDGQNSLANYKFSLHELRLYQTPNLLQKLAGKVQVIAPAPQDPKYPATNLITNLSSRQASSVSSTGAEIRPIKDAVGNQASHYSCYRVTDTQVSNDNLQIIFDLGANDYFVHAVVFVTDLWGEAKADNDYSYFH